VGTRPFSSRTSIEHGPAVVRTRWQTPPSQTPTRRRRSRCSPSPANARCSPPPPLLPLPPPRPLLAVPVRARRVRRRVCSAAAAAQEELDALDVERESLLDVVLAKAQAMDITEKIQRVLIALPYSKPSDSGKDVADELATTISRIEAEDEQATEERPALISGISMLMPGVCLSLLEGPQRLIIGTLREFQQSGTATPCSARVCSSALGSARDRCRAKAHAAALTCMCTCLCPGVWLSCVAGVQGAGCGR